MNPAIVIVAYDRPKSLRRLLSSLSCMNNRGLAGDIPLVISVDGGYPAEICQMARDFPWEHGEKNVVLHSENLGLRDHIISCGDLTERFESIVVLEDDLFVSPHFYQCAKDAEAFYAKDPSISGIALYSHSLNETAVQGFCPIHDGSDVFFMQLPCSWGQLWTRGQWAEFKKWHTRNLQWYGSDYSGRYADLLPANIRSWPVSSWKKPMAAYMVEQDRFVVYPRISLSTNFADDGVHCRNQGEIYQVPLLQNSMTFRLVSLAESGAVYDVHGEMLPDLIRRYCPQLAAYDFDVDLYGTKPLSQLCKPFTLTTKNVASPIISFGMQLKPHECNVLNGISDTKISLAKTEDVQGTNRISLLEKHSYYCGPYVPVLMRTLLNEKGGILKERETAIEQQHVALQERDAAFREQETKLKVQAARVKEQDAALREQDARLLERTAALREQDLRLQEQEGTIDALQVGEKELRKRLARCQHEIASIKGSRSWKITAPLRKARDFAIGLKSRLFQKKASKG
jgi:hypothetical protein